MALQSPQINVDWLTMLLNATGGGVNSSYYTNADDYATYKYVFEKSPHGQNNWSAFLTITTPAGQSTLADFTQSLVGYGISIDDDIRVWQVKDWDNYLGVMQTTYADTPSNIVTVPIVTLRSPYISYDLSTDILNIKVETSISVHSSINPLIGYDYYLNGVLQPRINTTSMDYNHPLAITENTTIQVVAVYSDGRKTSPSEPIYITYTDIPQTSTYTILGSDLIKTISETFNSIDNFINNRALMRFISSTINSSDLYKNIRGRLKTITSSISLSENIIKLQAIIEQIIYKIINDNVRLVEVKNRTMSKIRIISNQIGLTDGYKKIRGMFKSVSDSIGISDLWNYIVAKFIPNRRKSLDYKITMQPLRYKAEVDVNMGEYKNGVYYFSVGESQEIPITVASTDGSEFTIEDATFELVYNGTVLANGSAVLDDKIVFKLINFITPGTNQELKYKYTCKPSDVNKSAETLITRIPISVRT